MAALSLIIGLLILFIVLEDTFETIVLPRTVGRKLRLTRFFYIYSWILWAAIARRTSDDGRREGYLGVFGPLSLLLLICVWAVCLIVGFAMLQWGAGSGVLAPERHPNFGTDLYMSAVTFLTLGFGDVVPHAPLARFLSVLEAGVGFGFLAVVISYLPVLYQSFSRREVGISLLDARAGSPPHATELLRRHGVGQNMESLRSVLQDWERWAADLLESHLSYPVLAYYRSQHDRQSWLNALTAILDTCALISLGFKDDAAWQGPLLWQAQLTFAMARHAVVDLALVFNTAPTPPDPDRLPSEEWARLCTILASAGVHLRAGEAEERRLAELRGQYEPYVNSLAQRLLLTLPPWVAHEEVYDNWQTSAWEHHDHFYHA
jgi:hypothetical protein